MSLVAIANVLRFVRDEKYLSLFSRCKYKMALLPKAEGGGWINISSATGNARTDQT